MLPFLSSQEESIPVLLDTDIGSDIDDAVALAYLLKQPRCELVGITTVTGDVQQRAALAEVLCRAAGREDIPIHCGSREVLLFGPGQPEVPQYQAIAGLPHRLDRQEHSAVEFMLDTIRSRPGEIVLLTIGPLTNIALLFSVDPTVVGKLRGIVSMAGRHFSDPWTEWNTNCDPVASSITYSFERPNHVSVGLDVTMEVRMARKQVEEGFRGPLLEVVLKMAGPWFEHGSDLIFHDPLAAAVIFEPEICTYEQGTIEVTSNGALNRFSTGAGGDFAAKGVDCERFFSHYFDVTCG